MIAPDHSVLRVARLVLEAASPMSIGTGRGIGTFDTSVVADANGLPALPATSLKGVLRAACRGLLEPELLKDVFGYAEGDEGVPARLAVSWGWCHDGSGDPVVGRLVPRRNGDRRFSPTGDLSDPLLLFLLTTVREATVVRDRVRIGRRGSVDGTGKFDRTVVPRGVRFTIEFQLSGRRSTQVEDARVWDTMLGLLTSGELTVGGSTRGGLGRLVPVRDGNGLQVSQRTFVLDEAGFADYAAFRRAAADDGSLDLLDRISPTPITTAERHLHLQLEAVDTWRFGGGAVALGDDEVDAVPFREAYVDWDGDGDLAQIVEGADAGCVVIPATSVKGALRHRTAFHHRRRIGIFGATTAEEDVTDAAIGTLFGAVKGRSAVTRAGDGAVDVEVGRVGLVSIADAVLSLSDCSHQRIAHVSIDRFTGGARSGLLFDEEVLVGGRLDLSIRLLPGFDELAQDIRDSFFDAVRDLEEGRLALGGASGRGHGRFRKVEAGGGMR